MHCQQCVEQGRHTNASRRPRRLFNRRGAKVQKPSGPIHRRRQKQYVQINNKNDAQRTWSLFLRWSSHLLRTRDATRATKKCCTKCDSRQPPAVTDSCARAPGANRELGGSTSVNTSMPWVLVERKTPRFRSQWDPAKSVPTDVPTAGSHFDAATTSAPVSTITSSMLRSWVSGSTLWSSSLIKMYSNPFCEA